MLHRGRISYVSILIGLIIELNNIQNKIIKNFDFEYD